MSADPLEALVELLADRVADRVLDRLGKQQPQPPEPQAQFLDEVAVAARFSISRRTLQTWRNRGGGPPWVHAGRRVLYPIEGLTEFLKGTRTRQRAGNQHRRSRAAA